MFMRKWIWLIHSKITYAFTLFLVNPFTARMVCKHVNILVDVGKVGLGYFVHMLSAKGVNFKSRESEQTMWMKF